MNASPPLAMLLNSNRVQKCAQDWEDFKNVLQQAAQHIFNKERIIFSDWFDDNYQEIQTSQK